MSNPKDCIHCCDYEDMGCKMPVCEFDFPSINTPKCNGCSKFIKRDLVQVVRCKDCKYRVGSACDYSAVWVRPNGYCQWGRRKEDETN